jgi:hypothetical protein
MCLARSEHDGAERQAGDDDDDEDGDGDENSTFEMPAAPAAPAAILVKPSRPATTAMTNKIRAHSSMAESCAWGPPQLRAGFMRPASQWLRRTAVTHDHRLLPVVIHTRKARRMPAAAPRRHGRRGRRAGSAVQIHYSIRASCRQRHTQRRLAGHTTAAVSLAAVRKVVQPVPTRRPRPAGAGGWHGC